MEYHPRHTTSVPRCATAGLAACVGLVLAALLLGCSPATKTVELVLTDTPSPGEAQQPTSQAPVTEPTDLPVRNTWVWQGTSDNVVQAGQRIFFPDSGAEVQAGRTLTLRWAATGDVQAYVLTSSQYHQFLFTLEPRDWSARGYGLRGAVSCLVPRDDKYYVVLINPYTEAPLRISSASLTER